MRHRRRADARVVAEFGEWVTCDDGRSRRKDEERYRSERRVVRIAAFSIGQIMAGHDIVLSSSAFATIPRATDGFHESARIPMLILGPQVSAPFDAPIRQSSPDGSNGDSPA